MVLIWMLLAFVLLLGCCDQFFYAFLLFTFLLEEHYYVWV